MEKGTVKMLRAAETGPDKRRGEAKARAAAKRAGTTKKTKKIAKKVGPKGRPPGEQWSTLPVLKPTVGFKTGSADH